MTRIWNYPGLLVAWGLANGTWSPEQLVARAKSAGYRWIALQTPQGTDGMLLSEQIARVRAEMKVATGMYFGMWQELEMAPSLADVKHYRPNFWLANVETPNAHYRMVHGGMSEFRMAFPKLPAGVITNFGGIASRADATVYRNNHFVCIPEAYMNVNPQATPDAMVFEAVRRGWLETDVFPCYGVWGGYGLESYKVFTPRLHGHSVYLAEGLLR
jgi:hypothetical protein